MRHRQEWIPAPETASDALTALDPESIDQEDPIVAYSDPIEDIVAATLRDGGGTWTRELVPVGKPDVWAVGGSMPGYTLAADPPGCRRADLQDYREQGIARAMCTLIFDGAQHVGTWLDHGVVYIDAVDLIPDYWDALALARKRGELAIYNLSTEETIELTEEV